MTDRTAKRDRPTNGNGRWFVAIVPPDAVGDRVTALKQECADRFGTRQALKSPPHITLVPPFERSPGEIASVQQVLAAVAQMRSPFALSLDGFDAFGVRVLFLRPVENSALTTLQAALADRCQADCQIPRETRPFHAHMTVAFRDWQPAQFQAAWAALGDRPFRADFMVDRLALLRHRDGCWQVDQFFQFGDDPAGVDQDQRQEPEATSGQATP